MTIPTIQNPVFTCSICGKEEVQTNSVATGIPEYWACKECRDKMKKFSLSFTFYEDGFAEVSGNCDFCKQYPCRHGDESGEFTSPISPIKLSVVLRKRWLESLMMFPAAKMVPAETGKYGEVEVYWPLGAGGRPAEVYREIKDVLKVYECALATYKTDGDYHLGWIHRLADSAPGEKEVKKMLLRDGKGLQRMPDNLINWDWKEPRGTMVKDLNEAMEALKVPLKWKLGDQGHE